MSSFSLRRNMPTPVEPLSLVATLRAQEMSEMPVPEFAQTPLQMIATELRQLRYGDMKEFAAGIHADADEIWRWANR